jgi:photosystem II stability/assembly factor-like uncharacterized protein
MRRWIPLALLFLFAFSASAGWKTEGPYFGNVKSIVVDPAAPDHLWLSTHGGGVWRSVDGGKSWQLAGNELASYVIPFVVLQPKSSGTLFAGADGGALARSKDGGKTWEWMLDDLASTPHRPAFDPNNPKSLWLPDVNLHKRTADGGAKWTEFRISGGDVSAFAFHPTNSKIIWAGGVNGRSGLWRTSDGGTSWKQIGKGLPEMNHVHSLLVDPSNPDNLYMIAFRGGYKSTDGGDSWSPLGGSFQSSELELLVMHPKDPNTLFASSEKGFFRSTDGGDSWSEIDNGRWVATALAINPANPDTMWLGSAGGVQKTTDGGETWTEANNGLAASWIEKVWGDASGTMYAQLGRGLFRGDGRGGWTELTRPFSDERASINTIVFDEKNPKVVHVGDSWSYYRSMDGGATWKEIQKPFQDPKPIFNSLVPDPKNPKIYYCADSNADSDEPMIFKSVDGGVKWKASSKGVNSEGIVALRGDATGALLGLGKKGPLWKSVDGATTWTSIGAGLPSDDLEDFAIDPSNPSRMYVAVKKALYRSDDGGATFTPASLGVKEPHVEATIVDAKGNVYVATTNGILRSSDGGKSWSGFSEGMVNKDTRSLFTFGNRIYAGTAGAGVMSMELP